jgi:biopolymer transport protein ExbD
MRRHSRGQDDDGSVDLTPMLDVVFIMLIFFIVTATFVRESGIDVTRPDAETDQVQQNVAILIAISEDNQIWIDGRQVDIRAVRANVERLRAENPKGGVVIQADTKADTGLTVQVMDQAQAAGAPSVSIATEQD